MRCDKCSPSTDPRKLTTCVKCGRPIVPPEGHDRVLASNLLEIAEQAGAKGTFHRLVTEALRADDLSEGLRYADVPHATWEAAKAARDAACFLITDLERFSDAPDVEDGGWQELRMCAVEGFVAAAQLHVAISRFAGLSKDMM